MHLYSIYQLDQNMLRTVFVRGIPRSYDDSAFQKIFANHDGLLKSFLIRNNNGHKGIGFVEFDTSKHAQVAINDLDGNKLGDRELKLEFAKERDSFRERKKRKIQSLRIDEFDEKGFFESLGPHSRLRSIAIGGLESELLQEVKHKAQELGKVSTES